MNKVVKQLWYEAQQGFNDQLCDDRVVERFAELIVERCADVVIESDPSEKMILHEPYRTVMHNVMESLNDKDT